MRFSIRLLVLITMLVAVSLAWYEDHQRRQLRAAKIAAINDLSLSLQRSVALQPYRIDVGKTVVTLPKQLAEVEAYAWIRQRDIEHFSRGLESDARIVESACSRVAIDSRMISRPHEIESALMSELQQRGIRGALGIELKITHRRLR